jgi:hypothetical protein
MHRGVRRLLVPLLIFLAYWRSAHHYAHPLGRFAFPSTASSSMISADPARDPSNSTIKSRLEKRINRSSGIRFTLATCGAIGRLLALIPTYVYVVWLGLNITFRHIVETSASIALVLAAGMFFLETGAAIFHPAVAKHHPALWMQLTIVLLALFMLRHRLKEFSGLKRKPVFLSNTNVLLGEVAALDFNIADTIVRETRLNTFIMKVLIGFGAAFKDIGNVQLNVMFPDDGGCLRIRNRYPSEAQYDLNLALRPNEGGAGVAFERNSMVYIPRIRFRHGIMISVPTPSPDGVVIEYDLLESVYVPAQPEPYKAILSAPVRSATGEVVGILNLDLRRSNPFSEFDFLTAQVAASFIGMALDRYRTGS